MVLMAFYLNTLFFFNTKIVWHDSFYRSLPSVAILSPPLTDATTLVCYREAVSVHMNRTNLTKNLLTNIETRRLEFVLTSMSIGFPACGCVFAQIQRESKEARGGNDTGMNKRKVKIPSSSWIAYSKQMVTLDCDGLKVFSTLGGRPTLWKRRPTLGTFSRAYFFPLDFALSMAL